MGICAWIVFGCIAGWLASMVTGDNARMGFIGNLVAGVIGSMVGGFIFSYFGGSPVTGFNLYSMGVAVVGAVIVLFVKKKVLG